MSKNQIIDEFLESFSSFTSQAEIKKVKKSKDRYIALSIWGSGSCLESIPNEEELKHLIIDNCMRGNSDPYDLYIWDTETNSEIKFRIKEIELIKK